MKKDTLYRPSEKPLLILLDYDGTLTDFKKDPDRSFLPSSRRRSLEQLRRAGNIVILVTGRNLKRLNQVSGLKSFPAVGTHGFEDRYLPNGLHFATIGQKRLYHREANKIWDAVHSLCDSHPDIHIEKKPFSSTLHYRGADLSSNEEATLVREFTQRCRKVMTPRLWTLQKGKKMVEVMPKGFSKGKAVRKILSHHPDYFPIYAGDDVADIPALRAVRQKGGWGVAVGSRVPNRDCDKRFKTPAAFTAWLNRLI